MLRKIVLIFAILLGLLNQESNILLSQNGNFHYPDITISITPENPAFCNPDKGVNVKCNQNAKEYEWKYNGSSLFKGPNFQEVNLKQAGEYKLIILYGDDKVTCNKEFKFTVTDLNDENQIENYFLKSGFWALDIQRQSPANVACRGCTCEQYVDPVSFGQGNMIKMQDNFENIQNFKPLANYTLNKFITDNKCLCDEESNESNIPKFESKLKGGGLNLWGHQFFRTNATSGKLFVLGSTPWQNKSPLEGSEHRKFLEDIKEDILSNNSNTQLRARSYFLNVMLTHADTWGELSNDNCDFPLGLLEDFYLFTTAAYPVKLSSSAVNPTFGGKNGTTSGSFGGALIAFSENGTTWRSHFNSSTETYMGFLDNLKVAYKEFEIPYEHPFRYALPVRGNSRCNASVQAGVIPLPQGYNYSIDGGIGSPIQSSYLITNKGALDHGKLYDNFNFCPEPLDLPFTWQSDFKVVSAKGATHLIWKLNDNKYIATIEDPSSLQIYYYEWVNGCWILVERPPNFYTPVDLVRKYQELCEAIHNALDVAGAIPVIGTPADATNAYLYAIENNYTASALCMAGIFFEGAVLLKNSGKFAIKAGSNGLEVANGSPVFVKLAGIGYKQIPLDDIGKNLEELLSVKPSSFGDFNIWQKRIMDNLKADENFLRALIEDPKLVKGWAELYGTVAKSNIKAIKQVTKWVDVAKINNMTFKTVDDATEIAVGGSTIGKFTDDALEFSDDYFVPSVGSNSKSIEIKEIDFISGSSPEELFVNPSMVYENGKFIGWLEDASSFGTNLVQNAIKNRTKLRSVIEGIEAGEEAHHLFPVQLLKENDIMKKAVQGGFDFNGKVNAMALEKYVKSANTGRHGPHPKYTNRIKNHINKWGDEFVDGSFNKNKSPEYIAAYFRDVVAPSIRARIDETKLITPLINKIDPMP